LVFFLNLKGKGSLTSWIWELKYFVRKRFLDLDLSRQNVVRMPNKWWFDTKNHL
jgi:hypothetical protein